MVTLKEGWVKVNTDGALSYANVFSTAGGVIHNANGAWIQGFAFNTRACSVNLAELWDILKGLELA